MLLREVALIVALILAPAITTAGDEPASGPPREDLVALARFIAGGTLDEPGFTEEARQLLRSIQFPIAWYLNPHRPYFDTFSSTPGCTLNRAFLNHDGSVDRVELVAVKCSVYWSMIEEVYGYFQRVGSLPASSLDLWSEVDVSSFESAAN